MPNNFLHTLQKVIPISIAKRGELPRWSSIFVALLFCAALTLASTAQTVTSLLSFDGTNGATPEYGALVQGFDGRFYGTASSGGSNSGGTVFKVTPQGALTTLYNFCALANCADGKAPYGGVALGIDGNFYGTTSLGGVNGYGTVFKITPSGVFTVLHSFDETDGKTSTSQLVQGTDGEFYGTTEYGGRGDACGTNGCGTIFKITPGGEFFYLDTLTKSAQGPAFPTQGLIQGIDGDFYGTTLGGGGGCSGFGCGSFYKVTSGGVITVLAIDYGYKAPFDAPIQATNGNFYFTTSGREGPGNVLEVTPGGHVTALQYFGGSNGFQPIGGLVQATDGNLYGTTAGNAQCNGLGGYYCGSTFEITLDGTLTQLHSFQKTDGSAPLSALLQATDGNFYGMTSTGGSSNDGTIFELATGLGPFVRAVPTSNPVGKAVAILGNNLESATAVSFNGTPATFTASSSQINTTVPIGATTGTIVVTTPSGTLSSNVAFNVTP